MTEGRLALRATAALAIGAFGLHQLRYLLGYGGEASDALAAHGHGYLALAVPLIALVVAVAAGQFLAQLAQARSTGETGGAAGRFGRVWIAAAAVLFATYAGQELLEGAASAGHPGGIEAVLGGGGWWALPLAAVVGLLVAFVMRGADACLASAAGRRRSSARRALARSPLPVAVDVPFARPIARNLAGRAPPAASA
jgi:hypothetical protein